MREIIVDRPLPSTDAADAMHAALKAALGDKCSGFSARLSKTGALRIHLSEDATADDENTARQIALTHDFNQRTPAQIAQKERREKLEAARMSVAMARAPKDNDEAHYRKLVDYLLLEVANLRERVGD